MSFAITGKAGLLHDGGTWSIVDPEQRDVLGDCFTCCHCSRVVFVTPGSGKMRGHCKLCNKLHCGKPTCWTCTPFERELEKFEAAARLAASMKEW